MPRAASHSSQQAGHHDVKKVVLYLNGKDKVDPSLGGLVQNPVQG